MLKTTIPTLEIKTSGVDLSAMETVYVTIKQGNWTVVKSNDDIEVDDDVLSVFLTQEESYNFKESGGGNIFIMGTGYDGDTYNIRVVWVKGGSRTDHSGSSGGGGGSSGEATTVSVKVAGTITGAAGTNAKVENLGDDVNVNLKFTIPMGEQGIQGKPGQNGQDGHNGEDGADGKDGKSAYEIAIENGFSGTQTEWLESLKGSQGEPGAPGGYINADVLTTEEEVKSVIETGSLVDAMVIKDILEKGVGGNVLVLTYEDSLNYLNGDDENEPTGGVPAESTQEMSYEETMEFLNSND